MTPSSEHKPHKVLIGNQNLEFREFQFDDPVPTGRQLLAAYGCQPVEEYLAIALLPNGATETLRLDETFDLREHGVERVVTFHTDRTYRFEVDRMEREWGAAHITGSVIKQLANVDPQTHDLYQEVRGEDPLVQNNQMVDLSGKGVERYYTIISHTTEGLSALPPEDVSFLAARGIAYEVVSQDNQVAVILKDYPVPLGKFDSDIVDVLVLLPAGYPDAVVDMFYCSPWLRLKSTGACARAADVHHAFLGRDWQRWSRHNYDWRAGIDGIHTVLGRLDRALKEAA